MPVIRNNTYDLIIEKKDIANNLYQRILDVDSENNDALFDLSDEASEKLGISFLDPDLIEDLMTKANPEHFINPYNSEKVAKANALYAKLQ